MESSLLFRLFSSFFLINSNVINFHTLRKTFRIDSFRSTPGAPPGNIHDKIEFVAEGPKLDGIFFFGIGVNFFVINKKI